MSVQPICTAVVFIPQRVALCQPPATSGRIRRKMTTDGSQTAGRSGGSGGRTTRHPNVRRAPASADRARRPYSPAAVGQHLADEVVARVGLDEVDEVGDGPRVHVLLVIGHVHRVEVLRDALDAHLVQVAEQLGAQRVQHKRSGVAAVVGEERPHGHIVVVAQGARPARRPPPASSPRARRWGCRGGRCADPPRSARRR